MLGYLSQLGCQHPSRKGEIYVPRSTYASGDDTLSHG